MWCDGQPGSQPSISANEHGLLAGLWAVYDIGLWAVDDIGLWAEDDIDRIICISANFSLESEQGESEEGTDMMMVL